MKLYYPDNIMVMMDIRKISYETAELFLSANDQTVSDNIEILYQDVEGLIKIDNLFIPDEIAYYLTACYLKLINIPLTKYYTHQILAASFAELIPIAQQLKLGSIDKEQIYYILYFLGVFDDEIAYLENMPIDILLNIFQYLNNEDIVLLCNSSLKIRNIFVNNRSFFFPQLLSFVKELDDSTYVQSFGRCLKYKYFDIYRDQCYLYKFKNNIITSYCRLYQTKDNDIKNYENFRITRYLIKANRNIVQLVKINHIIYMLLDDGTILNKNLMTNEEFVSVSLKNCLHITNYNEKLIITLINGECYEWDGSLRKLGWIKDVIKVVSNVYLTIDDEVYCEGIKIADDIVQFSDYLPFMLNKQGELLYINNGQPTKLGDKQNLVKVISSPGGSSPGGSHYVVIMLDKNGNVLINKRSGVLLTGVEDIYFDLRITYGLYYIKDGLLNHVEIDNRTYQIKGEPVTIEW